MILIHFILSIFYSKFMYSIAVKDEQFSMDLIANDFIPSSYDFALSLFLSSFMITLVWSRFSFIFLSLFQVLSTSPIMLWGIRHTSSWCLILVFTIFIVIPGLLIIEKLEFHLGDYIMPALFVITWSVFD